MYEKYFTRRLLEELTRADEAKSAEERCTHLRASRYFRDLLETPDERRASRESVVIAAELHMLAPFPLPVVVTDLSSGGFRVPMRERVRPGTRVELHLNGLAPLEAFIAWQADGAVGFRFGTDLHPALLEAALALSPRVQ
jgi:hypothetical protein